MQQADDLQAEGALNFALAGACSTFLPLGGTLHPYRASSLLKGACVYTALQYHIQRSKTSATLTWDKGSDLTQSRSWNNHGCLPLSALKRLFALHTLIFKIFFFSPVTGWSRELVAAQCTFDVESQSLWIRCYITVAVNFCSTCECLPLSLC